MLSPEIHAERRAQLARTVDGPILHRLHRCPRWPFVRACTLPGALTPALRSRSSMVETLYLPVPAEDDALWHGACTRLKSSVPLSDFRMSGPAACRD